MQSLQQRINESSSVNEDLNKDIVIALLEDNHYSRFFSWIFDLQNPHVSNFLFWYNSEITKKVFLEWFEKYPDQVNFFFTSIASEYREELPKFIDALIEYGCKFHDLVILNPCYYHPCVVKKLNIELNESSASYFLDNFIYALEMYLDDPEDSYMIEQIKDHYECCCLFLTKENANKNYIKQYFSKLRQANKISKLVDINILKNKLN
jgi:hypothetical protein